MTKLQLGGNKEWREWLNLDETAPVPFYFAINNKFPTKNNSQDIIYSSHLLEHLPRDVVHYVLTETHRVMKSQGDLIIKIPDFDLVLQNWRVKNHKFFDQWGIRKIVSTWKSRGIPDTINYRCSMIFCGFWNNEYGHHFAGKRRSGPLAYHGPVPMPENELIDLLSINRPTIISDMLRDLALQQGDITFNHQTAWGEKDFHNLLRKNDFFVQKLPKQEIIEKYSIIPDIKDKYDISLYTVAYKI